MQTNKLLALLLSTGALSVHAATVTHMTLADTISASANALGTDGKSGAYRVGFPWSGFIDPTTYASAYLFSGDVNNGIIDVTRANAVGSFSTGHHFTTATNSGEPVPSTFVPYTLAPIVADITHGVLTITSLPMSGKYSPVLQDFNFNLSPDAGSLTVHNLIALNATDYAYRIGWSHDITTTDDPTGMYVGFTTRWMLEGVMSTATGPVPEPETYTMMLAGLGLVGAAARRRKARHA